MRNRTLLSLIEMLLMVMVFAGAAAICLRAFVFADTRSREGGQEAQAALLAQSAAQVLSHCEGDGEEAAGILGGECGEDGLWTVYYDENGNACEKDGGVFVLEAATGSSAQQDRYTGKTTVTVRTPDGQEIFSIPAAWQTEDGGTQ